MWGVVFGLTLWSPGLAGNDAFVHLGETGATLAILTTLGGLVRMAFTERDRGLREQQEDAQFARNILADLKTVYDRVERCRLLVEAHRSARTYGEEMRNLIDGVVTLHKIKRAIDPKQKELREGLAEPIRNMSAFLKNLIGEFQREYRPISRLQEYEEAWNKAERERLSQAKEKAEAYKARESAWEAIEKLPILAQLRRDEHHDTYERGFLDHLDAASQVLRARLPGGNVVSR